MSKYRIEGDNLTPWEQARLERRRKRAEGFQARHEAFHARNGFPVPWPAGCTVCASIERSAA